MMSKRKKMTFLIMGVLCVLIVIFFIYSVWLFPKFEEADYAIIFPSDNALKGRIYTLDEGKRLYLIISNQSGNKIEGYHLYLNMSKDESDDIFYHSIEYKPNRIFSDTFPPRVLCDGEGYAYIKRFIKDPPHYLNTLVATIVTDKDKIELFVEGAEIPDTNKDWSKELLIYRKTVVLKKKTN